VTTTQAQPPVLVRAGGGWLVAGRLSARPGGGGCGCGVLGGPRELGGGRRARRWYHVVRGTTHHHHHHNHHVIVPISTDLVFPPHTLTTTQK